MYNRYTPQPDGSFQRNRMPDSGVVGKYRQDIPMAQRAPQQPPVEAPAQISSPKHSSKRPPKKSDTISGFFQNLLPKNLDTGDLMVILLLLLIAGDCEEDKNNVLLTLALYFFM